MPRTVPLLLVTLALTVCAATAHASAVQLWSATRSLADADVRVAAVPGDGAYFAGTHDSSGTRIVVERLDADGALRWERFIAGPAPGWDRLDGLAVDADGAAVVLGHTGSRGGDYQVLVGKLRADGTAAWTRVLGRAPACSDQFDGMALAVDSQRRPVVAFGDGCAQVVAKLSPDGDTLWTRRFESHTGQHGLDGDVPTGIAIDGDDRIVVAGVSGGSTGYQTLAYATDGTLRWSRIQPSLIGSLLGPALVAIGPQGRVCLAGSPETLCGLPCIMAWGYDAAGAALGSRTFGGCEGAAACAVATDAAGDVVVGATHDFRYHTLVSAPDFSPLWDAVYAGTAPGDASHLVAARVVADGRVVVTGGASAPGNTEVLTTIAYAPGGAVEWIEEFGAPASTAYGRCLDHDGDRLYVAGSRFDATRGALGVALCYRSSATAAAPDAPRAAAVRTAPNPFRDATRIGFAADRPSRVRVDVFDAAGRRVRAVLDGRLAAGRHVADWDGRDAAGQTVPPGVYVVRLDVGGRVTTGRVLRLE